MTAVIPKCEKLCAVQEPLVSVVMPARNEEKYIGTAIESILRQSYTRLELIVVDDRSSDRTLDVVRSFRDSRITVYQKQTNEIPGAPASRNIGVQQAKGELIAYQDADDFSYPNRLERQIIELQRGKEARVVGTWIEYRLGANARVPQLPTSHSEIVAGFLRLYNRVTFVSGTMLLPRFLAIQIPGRSRFRYFEDWDQLCRFNELGTIEFRNIPEPLYAYNVRPKGSKGQADWAIYNVYERACRSRRYSGLKEWETRKQFEQYLNQFPLQFLRWRTLQLMLHLKSQCELWRIRRSNESVDEKSSATWK